MHQRCSYFMCKNKSNTKAMFRFPLDRRRLLVWLERCGNMFITQLHPNQLRNRFICIDHFDDKYIRNRHGRRTRIDKQAIPKPYCFLPSMLEQEPSTISKRECSPISKRKCSPISKRECSPISKRECSPRRKPEQSPVPGLFDLEVLLPIKVYRNRKAPVDPIDDFQWSNLNERKEANQEYDMPKYISFKALSDQTKIVIAKVYHYFEQEYEELKKSFDGLEQTPLSKFRQRTALATGVSETTVVEILQEEARRNAEAREEPSPNESRARKRPRQTDSSSEDDSDNIEDGDDELSSAAHEEETLVVKEEPAEEPLESDNEEPEIYVRMPVPGVSGANDSLADPISLELKTEPPSEEAASSNDTLVAQRDTKSFKRRKMKRRTESPPSTSASLAPNAPQIPNAPPSPNAPPTPNAPPAPPKRQLRLLDDGDIKLEQIDSEEGFS